MLVKTIENDAKTREIFFNLGCSALSLNFDPQFKLAILAYRYASASRAGLVKKMGEIGN